MVAVPGGSRSRVRLDRGFLVCLRRRALRAGVWFRVLSAGERGIVELTARAVEDVRSVVLATVLARIVGKLLGAWRSVFLARLEVVGRPLAEGLSAVAERWGYVGAKRWRLDKGYVRLLGLNALSSQAWGVGG